MLFVLGAHVKRWALPFPVTVDEVSKHRIHSGKWPVLTVEGRVGFMSPYGETKGKM